jgi:hypothetical protein
MAPGVERAVIRDVDPHSRRRERRLIVTAEEQQSSRTSGLRAGDSVPDDVQGVTLDGRCLRYRDIWQKRLLLLVTVPELDSVGARRYLEALRKDARELTAHDTEVLVSVKPDQPPAVVIEGGTAHGRAA